ncbi:accessory Sec system S-layer assembly protein [Calidifontibacillus oryziterrae]|uniref:accessory Sec system S-layer assembly protein n=1 Tax=Calidifontibacillus oryziterrae TaxID=1191699 RepID=UPI0002D7ECB4|nr:accessory Sec system S-layer assembly protein [Calidifontibacillus oryziterrae]
MLSFFKRKKDTEDYKNTGSDNSISAKDLVNVEGSGEGDENEEVYTELSIHPEWNIPQEQEYVFRFLNNELSPLKRDEVSLSGIEIEKTKKEVICTAFVRSSINQAIEIGTVTLILIGENEIYGRKEFDFTEIGHLPANSSRPWQFVFQQQDLYKPIEKIETETWGLAFDLQSENRNHTLDLAESWEKSLADEDKEKLRNMVASMTPPKPGEVQFVGLQSKFREDGKLQVSVLIQNGTDQNIKLEQLPLVVEDASGEIVAQGGFVLEDLQIKPNTSKPWNFVFPTSLFTKDRSEIDLTTWRAYPPQE